MFKIAVSLDDQDQKVVFLKQRPDMFEFVCEDCGSIFSFSDKRSGLYIFVFF